MNLLDKIPGRGNRTIATAIAWGIVRYAQAQGWVPEGVAEDVVGAIEAILLVLIPVFLRLGIKNGR